MTGSGLPPQAYTKETLAEAYEWLKSQTTDIRRAANNSDSLVGLYLSAQRRKQEGFDSFYDRNHITKANDSAPISGEQFKKELKSLAIGLNEFVDDRNTQGALPSVSPPQVTTPNPDYTPFEPPHGSSTGTSTLLPPTSPGGAATPHLHFSEDIQQPSAQRQHPTSHGQQPPTQRQQVASESTTRTGLDSLSLQKLAAVQSSLNLSSETEAMRMLITLGFEKIKDILPPS